MSRMSLGLWLVAGVMVTTVVVGLSGCGGSSDNTVFLNVVERGAWGSNGRVAFSSYGGDLNAYVYTISSDGGGLTLMTPAATTTSLAQQGGRNPIYNSDCSKIAMSARRTDGTTEGIYLIDGVHGESTSIARVSPNTTDGFDLQPAWVPAAGPDAGKIVYTTTRDTAGGYSKIVMVSPSDTAHATQTLVDLSSLPEPMSATWASVSPDGLSIVYTAYQGAYRDQTPAATNLYIKTIASAATDGGKSLGTLLTTQAGGAARIDRNDGASFNPANGNIIAFHSNRGGAFDIWQLDMTDGKLTQIAQGSATVGSGFPTYKPDGTRIIFNRGMELWAINVDGTNAKQVTRRY